MILEEFCKDYRHPVGYLFAFEMTCSAITCVYANVIGTVRATKRVFDLNDENLVSTRKAH